MKLKKILHDIDYELIQGNIDNNVSDIAYNSSDIKPNMAFVCLVGIDTNGHNYIEEAIKNGAKSIIICEDININNSSITVVKIKDTRKELGKISSNFFENPGKDLIKIGITGTKGKTTTSWMIKNILEKNNDKVILIGTTGTYINNKKYEHKNTTPESYLIQKFMREAVNNNVKYLIMEVSSIGLKASRVNNIIFDFAIFTNLSYDHIGPREHKTYEDYIESKAKLFKQSKIGVINKDDKEYEKIIKGSSSKIYTYGTNNTDVVITNIKNNLNTLKTTFTLKEIGDYTVSSFGNFQAYNATSAILICKLLKIEDSIIKEGLETYYAPGRLKIIDAKKFKVIIDFAHNNISIENIIKTMREYNPNHIITVFGCGGGRSKQIRHELGKIAGKLSDICIITADNPRYDDITIINNDIKEGIKKSHGKYKIINDRKEAILFALKYAKYNDVVLLLGKGHEKYQEIKNEIIPFDEEQIVNDYIRGNHGSTI